MHEAVALIAHDAKKDDLVAWVGRHLRTLRRYPLAILRRICRK